MEKDDIVNLIRDEIKKNLSVFIETDQNFWTKNTTIRVEVRYGDEVIATSDDYISGE